MKFITKKVKVDTHCCIDCTTTVWTNKQIHAVKQSKDLSPRHNTQRLFIFFSFRHARSNPIQTRNETFAHACARDMCARDLTRVSYRTKKDIFNCFFIIIISQLVRSSMILIGLQ